MKRLKNLKMSGTHQSINRRDRADGQRACGAAFGEEGGETG
jgi:hypothetical protein